jgi:hypothetical protein
MEDFSTFKIFVYYIAVTSYKYSLKNSFGLSQENIQDKTDEKHKEDTKKAREEAIELFRLIVNDPIKVVHVNSGKPDFSVSEHECEQYANSLDKSLNVVNQENDPRGCYVYKANGNIIYNTQSTKDINCKDTHSCVQKPFDPIKFVHVKGGKPSSKYKVVSSGKNNHSVSESECKDYADTHGLKFSIHDDTPSSYKRFPNGACYCGTPYGGIDGRYGSITDERRYTGGWATANGYTDEKCKNTCLNKLPESKVVQGCSRLPVSKHRSNKKDVVVYVKNAREEHIPCGPSTTGKCIQKDPNSKYVSEQECKTYMESKGYGFKKLDYAAAVSGCFYAENLPFEPIKGFYNTNSNEGKCAADLPEGVEDKHNISCVQKQ